MALPHDTDLRGCASARCDFTRDRIQADFYEGLEEMAKLAGDEAVDRADLQTRFVMPVFCVSSFEHQKLAGVRCTPPRRTHQRVAFAWARVS